MFDAAAIGELLIDFSQVGTTGKESALFQANPGGAPCNVLAMLSRLNMKTAFIGKVGNDIFGYRLKAALGDAGINSDGLIFDEKIRTTLAFVENDENGERSFSFFRNPGADMMLSPDETDTNIISSSRVLHFGTLSMTHSLPEAATVKAITIAKRNGAIISFDPNLRPLLWESIDDALKKIDYGCSVSDIVKLEQGELLFLTGCKEPDAAVDRFKRKYKNVDLLTVTSGRDGSRAYFRGLEVQKPALLNSKTIDTTGAGDTFCACCLFWYLKNKEKADISCAELEQMLLFANAAASIITTRKGALLSMPCVSEIEALAQVSVFKD